MNRMLLVDGHNLLFQMFFGMPARITGKDDRPMQGTLGFVGALLKIIHMVNPSHILVLFDGEHENDRMALDAQYKANRTDYSTVPDEDNPFSQLPDIYASLDCLGIRHTEIADGEADDAIAAYVLTYGQEFDIVISSFDSDFFQLISPHVRVLRYRGTKTVLCDTAYIREKFGIRPDQYADFKCLVGDHADNIKGVTGIGPKTAAKLLGAFGTLENILLHRDNIPSASLRASLAANTERLMRNRALIRLENRAALPFPPQALTFTDPGLTTTQILRSVGLW